MTPPLKRYSASLLIGFILLLAACGPEAPTNINYPPTGTYGDNILLPTRTNYTNRDNSLEAMLPANNKVKIVITGKSVTSGSGLSGIWSVAIGTQKNWSVGTFDPTIYAQTFTSVNGGQTSDLKIMFDKGTYQIDYFENGVSTPSATNTIVVNY